MNVNIYRLFLVEQRSTKIYSVIVSIKVKNYFMNITLEGILTTFHNHYPATSRKLAQKFIPLFVLGGNR